MPRSEPGERTRARRGFTLIELLAAMTLAGATVVTVALFINQLDVTRRAIERTSIRLDGSANGERVLRELVERTEIGLESARQFSGDPTNLVTPTWCDAPGGWLERCMVRIALDHRRDSTAVDAQFEDNSQIELVVLPGVATLAYMGRGLSGTTWITTWGRGIVPPAAIGLIRQGADTVVVRIGERG